jgi:hypothetical protein
VTTQLRLVEPPEPLSRPAADGPSAERRSASGNRTSGRSRARGVVRGAARRGTASRSGRRTASWGEWHLDAGTRRVGRAGVAQARRALEAVVEQELRAS